MNAKASAAAEDAKREAELQAQYVIVPLGNEAQVVSCSICKETFASEFLEDEEDWVWKNAVKKDDKVRFFFNSFAFRSDSDKRNHRYFMRLVMPRLFH